MEEKIELRSEKVRNLIGKPPRFLIRMGTGMFFLLLCCLFLGSLIFPVQKSYTTSSLLSIDSTGLCVVKIPLSFLTELDTNSKVTINFDNDPTQCLSNLAGTIKTISDTIYIESSYSFKKATVMIDRNLINNCNIPLVIESKIMVSVDFFGKKQSFFNLLVSYFFN